MKTDAVNRPRIPAAMRGCLIAFFAGGLAFGMMAADPPARWWKGNLHTHSLWSDGDDYPEMIADWYRSHGYHFLGISDHNTLHSTNKWVTVAKSKGGTNAFQKYLARFGSNWVERRGTEDGAEVRLKKLDEYRGQFEEPARFLLIQSEEISDRYKTSPIHVNAHNLRERISPRGGESIVQVMQNNIDAVFAQRERTGVPMIPHLNHPNFQWAITAEELMQVKREQFFEVYNGHPLVHNEGDATRAGLERVWDIVLAKRLSELGLGVMFGFATDDSHHYHKFSSTNSNAGRGWIWVRAAELTPERLIAALEAGEFYASSGVTLKEVRREDGRLSVKIEPEPGVTYTTEFIGTRKGFDRRSEPVRTAKGDAIRVTHRYGADIGAVLATVKGANASYAFKGDELYVRARVTSSKRKENPDRAGEFEKAWIQPVVLK
jgi:hypothetical protein